MTIARNVWPWPLLLALLTTSCMQRPSAAHIPEPNGALEIAKGQQLTITLDANPTTGFAWQLAAPLDEKIVALVGDRHEQPDTERVGAGGTEVWTFKAVGTGSTTIVLEYRRPWEKDQVPAERKTFPIVVR